LKGAQKRRKEMRTIKVQLYQFDELTEEAREKAREWFRDGVSSDFQFFSEYIIDDTKTIGKLFGLDIKHVFYSGFYSQGDGAFFEGSYEYKKDGLKKVKEYAPKDEELHKIVSELQEIQRVNFYSLSATIKHSGFYTHSGCMVIDVWDNRTDNRADTKTAEVLRGALKTFADWIYNRLEKEYEYQSSDETVDETIRVNEYEFLENGLIECCHTGKGALSILSNDGTVVANMGHPNGHDTHLISAAPDLLEALEAFLRAPSIGSDGPGSHTIVVQDFNIRAARAAITKATGKTEVKEATIKKSGGAQ
jgi:hypothetical protein